MGEEREKSKTARMKGKKYEGRKGEREIKAKINRWDLIKFRSFCAARKPYTK